MGLLIIPKWLILTPGHTAILFGWFLELPTTRSNLDPRTLYSAPIYFKNTRRYGRILGFLFFVSDNLKLWKCWKVCVPHFLKYWIFDNLKIRILENCKIDIGKLDIWKLEVWKLKVRQLDFLFWKLRARQFFIKICDDGHRKWWKLVKQSPKSWIWISYRSKTWNANLLTSLFSSKGIPSTP